MKCFIPAVLLLFAAPAHAQIYTWDELGCYQHGAVYRDGLGKVVDAPDIRRGDKFEFYDGGGYWGNWDIEITSIDDVNAGFTMRNRVTKEVRRETANLTTIRSWLDQAEWSWVRRPEQSVLVSGPKTLLKRAIKEKRKRIPLAEAPAELFRKPHQETWAEHLAKCREIVALEPTVEELEIFKRVSARYDAMFDLEDERRHKALQGEPEAEIQR